MSTHGRNINFNNVIYVTPQSSPTAVNPVLFSLNAPHIFKSRKGLGPLQLNFRSLRQHQKLDHIKILVSQADPDLLVLIESWLKKSVSDSDVTINDYN